MIPEFTIAIPLTGFLVLITHPVFFEKYRYFEGNFFIYKLMELGIIAYSLAMFLVLLVQKIFESFLQHFYPNSPLLNIFSTIIDTENGLNSSLFWSIFMGTFPIVLCWTWSRMALFLFNQRNNFWKKNVDNPITKLLLCYSLSKETPMSHLILNSLIDQKPLLFALKGEKKSYIGLPTLIEVCSYSSQMPFKNIAIFPLYVNDEDNDFLDSSTHLLKKFGLSIVEEQIFIASDSIQRISVLSV